MVVERGRLADDAGSLGWAGTLMRWLAWVARLVGLNLLWGLGALAGGVLLGVLPASFAVTEVLRRSREGDLDSDLDSGPAGAPSGDPGGGVWRVFWRTWRSHFARANLLGLPFWGLSAIVVADVAVFLAAPDAALAWLLVPFGAVALVTVIAAAHLAPVALRYDVPARRVWRWVFLAPLSAPLEALVLAMGLALFATLVWWWPVLLVLGGASIPLWLADSVVARRLR